MYKTVADVRFELLNFSVPEPGSLSVVFVLNEYSYDTPPKLPLFPCAPCAPVDPFDPAAP